MKIEEIKDVKNVLIKIKKFSKKSIKVINDILILINKIYEFFDEKYLSFANRVFIYFNNNIFTKAFNI